MSFDHDTTFQTHSDIESKVLDGEAVLLNTVTGAYFSLNEVGTRIWESYRDGRSVFEVTRELCEAYDIQQDQAQSDVYELTRDLLASHLITVIHDESPTSRFPPGL